MAWKAQRDKDPNSAGGIAQGGAESVLINGRKAGIPEMDVTPHSPCWVPVPSHCSAKTVSKCKSVIIEGKPALRTKIDKDTCGHPRAVGSEDVIIGD
jgi:hypothetical protein